MIQLGSMKAQAASAKGHGGPGEGIFTVFRADIAAFPEIN
jgi:hypothetical protein